MFSVVLTPSSDCCKLNEIYKLFLLFIESQNKYLTLNNANIKLLTAKEQAQLGLKGYYCFYKPIGFITPLHLVLDYIIRDVKY